MSHSDVTQSPVLIGQVKWFNNNTGYGFVSVLSNKNDIFVHHSAIDVSNQQYKYLVQGEYVEFVMVPTKNNSTHEFQASNVRGIGGGKLMCETRRDFKLARSTHYTNTPARTSSRSSSPGPGDMKRLSLDAVPKQQRPPKSRGQGPRSSEWTNVVSKRNIKQPYVPSGKQNQYPCVCTPEEI
jgi:CspA family cold shock protein